MNCDVKGSVISFKRFEIHDGDGIRTTLFLKGCPLHCRWCHNPESISPKPKLALYASACTACGRCVRACPQGVHRIDADGVHRPERDRCIGCGQCVDACPSSALMLYGGSMTVGEALDQLLRDKPFYDKSGGGVTLSGGEPLMQPAFCRALLCALKEHGVSTAIDTCGYAAREAIDAVLPYTDTFLFDVKAYDEQTHVRATGVSNRIILENLKYIDAAGARIEVRIPLVPGYNDSEIPEIAALLAELRSLVGVRILPYHNYAEDKYVALGMQEQFATIPCPTEEQLAAAREALLQKLPASLLLAD